MLRSRALLLSARNPMNACFLVQLSPPPQQRFECFFWCSACRVKLPSHCMHAVICASAYHNVRVCFLLLSPPPQRQIPVVIRHAMHAANIGAAVVCYFASCMYACRPAGELLPCFRASYPKLLRNRATRHPECDTAGPCPRSISMLCFCILLLSPPPQPCNNIFACISLGVCGDMITRCMFRHCLLKSPRSDQDKAAAAAAS